MKKFPDKKQIVQILFAAAVILLIVNIIVGKTDKVGRNLQYRILNDTTINKKFINALHDFGLKDEWIKEIRYSKKNDVYKSYRVDIPSDLPIPVVLEEINTTFYNTNVELNSDEKKVGGETILKLLVDNDVRLYAEFNYNDSIKRDAGSVGLLVTGLSDLDTNAAARFADVPENFAGVLIPSKAVVPISQYLLEDRKEFVVELNDDIPDLSFKLNKNFSKGRLRDALGSITAAFPQAIFYIIDGSSGLSTSSTYSFLKKELNRRNIALVSGSDISILNGSGNKELIDNFRQLVESTKNAKSKLIMISADDFKIVRPEIFRLIKIGYKFINPSLVLKQNSGEKTDLK
jgi:hypothetical protein